MYIYMCVCVYIHIYIYIYACDKFASAIQVRIFAK